MSITNITTTIMEALSTQIIATLEGAPAKHGKAKVADLVQLFQSEEVQTALTAIVSANIKSVKKANTAVKLKDPHAPKRGKSAYLFYCNDKRAEVTARMRITAEEFEELPDENPNGTDKNRDKTLDVVCKKDYSKDKDDEDYYNPRTPFMSKELGRMWKELSDKHKKKYVKMADRAKDEYKTAIADYERPSDEELAALPENQRRVKRASKESKPRKTKDPNAPKRPTSAFLYFSKDMRATIKEENPELDGKDVQKEVGRVWKEDYADEKKRAKWVALAAKDKERYEAEKAEYSNHSDASTGSKKAPKPKKVVVEDSGEDSGEDSSEDSEDEELAPEPVKTERKRKHKEHKRKEHKHKKKVVVVVPEPEPESEPVRKTSAQLFGSSDSSDSDDE